MIQHDFWKEVMPVKEQMETKALREWVERSLEQDGDDWERLRAVLDELRRREGWTAPVLLETAWEQFRAEVGIPKPARPEPKPAALLRFALRHMRRAAACSLLTVAGTALLFWAADWLRPLAAGLAAGLAFLALFRRRRDGAMLLLMGLSQRQMRQTLTTEQLTLCLLGMALGLGLRLLSHGLPGLTGSLLYLVGILLGTLCAAACMGRRQSLALLRAEA